MRAIMFAFSFFFCLSGSEPVHFMSTMNTQEVQKKLMLRHSTRHLTVYWIEPCSCKLYVFDRGSY